MIAEIVQGLGDPAHADPADADEMDEADGLRHLHARTPFLNSLNGLPAAIASVSSPSNLAASGRPVACAFSAMAASRTGIGHRLGQNGGDALRRKLRLAYDFRPAGRLERGGIGRLVVIERVGIGHEQCGTADRRDLGDRRGAGSRDDQMRLRHAARQVGEERRHLGLDAKSRIGLTHACLVFRAGLLGDGEPRPHGLRKLGDRRRNGVGEKLRALASAEDEEAESLAHVGRRIGLAGLGDDRRPHRIPGEDGLVGIGRAAFGQEAAGNRRHPRGKQPVGAPHDRVLLVYDRGYPQAASGEDRRHGGIAAEADDGRRFQRAEQGHGLTLAAPQRKQCARNRHRVLAGKCRGGDDVDLLRGKGGGETLGPRIGHEVDAVIPRHEFVRQRFGRKEMAAGSPR